MTPEQERKRAARHERKRQRFGTSRPVCALCGYDCIASLVEVHHVAAEANDSGLVVALCRNHHGELSDAHEDSLRELRHRDSERDPLTRLSAMFLGLADFLRLLAGKLEAWATWLIAVSVHLLTHLGARWWTKIDVEPPQ